MDRVLALVIALVTMAAAAQTPSEPFAGAAGERPGLAGRWLLNREQSEDVRQKMEQARRRSGGNPGPGGPRGGWGGRPGGRGAGDGRTRPEGAPPSLDSLLDAPSEMTITQTEVEMALLEKDGRLRLFHPDGKTYREGSGAEVKARWEGGALVVETKSERGPTVTETFRLAPDEPMRLEVSLRVEGRFQEEITIRRVYDAAPPP